MKTDRKLAEELDRLKDTGHELDGYVPVEGHVVRKPRAVLSIRVGSDELDQIENAALAIGQNVSEFIRDAALQRSGEDNLWQALLFSRLSVLLAELRSIESGIESIQDALGDAFEVASHTKGGAEAIAAGYRAQIDVKLDALMVLRKSLDEFWTKTSAA